MKTRDFGVVKGRRVVKSIRYGFKLFLSTLCMASVIVIQTGANCIRKPNNQSSTLGTSTPGTSTPGTSTPGPSSPTGSTSASSITYLELDFGGKIGSITGSDNGFAMSAISRNGRGDKIYFSAKINEISYVEVADLTKPPKHLALKHPAADDSPGKTNLIPDANNVDPNNRSVAEVTRIIPGPNQA